MYCNNCGKALSKDVAFCPNCGAAISSQIPSYSSTLQPFAPQTHSSPSIEAQPKKTKKGLVIAFAAMVLLLGAVALLLSSSSSDEDLVKDFLQAHYTCDTELGRKCVPEALWIYFRDGILNAGNDFIEDIDISVTYVKELSSDEILSMEHEYRHETGVILEIDEARLYTYQCILYFEEHGEKESITENDRMRGIVVAKIDGKWYALPRGL